MLNNKEQNLINITIDEAEVKMLVRERIADLVKEVDTEYIFWDTKELRKRTCMSWGTIQNTFFYDPRFIKHKVGSKWYFPVRQTKEFLERWLLEQPKY